MITKQLIKEVIAWIFNNPNDAEYIIQEQEFNGYPIIANPVSHKYFYLSLNGGYETDFNGDFSYLLSNCVLPDFYILRGERTVVGENYFKYNPRRKSFDLKDRKKVDIICIDSNDIGSTGKANFSCAGRNKVVVDSSIMLGHNCTGQGREYLTNHMINDLYTCQELGISNNYFIGLLSDINLVPIAEGKEVMVKYWNEANRNRGQNVNYNFIHTINHIRQVSGQLDANFIHLIFPGEYLQTRIYIHVFIVKLDTNMRFDNTENSIKWD